MHPVGSKILVVEDDESMRELLRMHLSAAGYDVGVAEDGIAAGYAVLQTTPDLIICDIEMPNMDGLQFVAALREDKSLPKIPVIFLTSHEESDARARELGACAFLTKPVLADWLLTAVRQALAG
jgi:CheY-like chemotaxis protein